MIEKARIELLDCARGVALVAMTIFHFAFDLELLGVQEPGFISQPHWKYFARAIATSFLFLAGFSLFLAHGREINWSGWKLRMIKICAAALVITVATYFATPGQYIFFGILHQIAFASLAGLAFFALPASLIVAIAAAVFVGGFWYETGLADHWLFWWSGLQEVSVKSSDYVPVFPWFSAPLLGIAAAKLSMQNGWLSQLAVPQFKSAPSRLMKFLGRNSLVYYLIHQPVMIAFLMSVLYVTGSL